MRLSELEPNDANHKREVDRLGKQIAVRDAARRATEEKARQAELCPSDWRKCQDNANLMNNYKGVGNAQASCEIEAEKRARFGSPKWPWVPFSTFHTGDEYVRTGTAILIEKDAQFQNVFGAMAHSTVICTYDLAQKKVLDVSIGPN